MIVSIHRRCTMHDFLAAISCKKELHGTRTRLTCSAAICCGVTWLGILFRFSARFIARMAAAAWRVSKKVMNFWFGLDADWLMPCVPANKTTSGRYCSLPIPASCACPLAFLKNG